MPHEEVVLGEQEATLANRIQSLDEYLNRLDESQARLLNAGMKVPTPLGAGLYKREEAKNDTTKEELLQERAELVGQLQKLLGET